MNEIVEAALAGKIARQLGQPIRLKTWSLIVTVFGDCILPRGGSISAMALGDIMRAMGIEAGAVRTAISRLASEGYVERNRVGRTSYYRLAQGYEAEFRKAVQKIYPAAASFTGHYGDWVLACFPSENPPNLDGAGLVRVSRDWYVANLEEVEDLPESVMIYRGNFVQMPDWFQKLLTPQEEHDSMLRLIEVFGPLEAKFEKSGLPSPLEALALRCLLIHTWRRIAFRLKGLPPTLLADDWPEAECRNLVARIYEQLLDPSEAWLTADATCETGSLPDAEYELFERFH